MGQPNQRLHLTPRLGYRGRDRVCYRFWLLAITQSFRGAGEPRPLGGQTSSTETPSERYAISPATETLAAVCVGCGVACFLDHIGRHAERFTQYEGWKINHGHSWLRPLLCSFSRVVLCFGNKSTLQIALGTQAKPPHFQERDLDSLGVWGSGFNCHVSWIWKSGFTKSHDRFGHRAICNIPSAFYGVHTLCAILRSQGTESRRIQTVRLIRRLCRGVLLAVVLPDWHLVSAASDQQFVLEVTKRYRKPLENYLAP
jgi:hypothetical protein